MNIQNPALRFGALVVYRHPNDLKDKGLHLPEFPDKPEKMELWAAPLRVQVVPANAKPTPETGITETLPVGTIRIGAGLVKDETADLYQAENSQVATFVNNHFQTKKPDTIDRNNIEKMDKMLGTTILPTHAILSSHENLSPYMGWIASLMSQVSHYRGVINHYLIHHEIIEQLLHSARDIKRQYLKNPDQQDIVEYVASTPNRLGP